MTHAARPTSSPRRLVDFRTGISLVWMLLFCGFFYAFGLPNNPKLTRLLVWQEFVPWQLLDVAWPPPEPGAAPAGWSYLPERSPAIFTALMVLAAALGYGRVVLQLLRLDRELSRTEAYYFASGIGFSLGSLVTLGLGLSGWLSPVLLWAYEIIGGLLLANAIWRDRSAVFSDVTHELEPAPPSLKWVILAVCLPVVWSMLLGAVTPQTDFDVLAYHLNGPKEWYQQGAISFLSHNVYTSFPFLTEMHLLTGMVLLGDWSDGALAGQAVLMLMTPLTALGLLSGGRRWFSPAAGWLAALIWLTTPWAYRISIIAYAEGGLAFYLLATFLAFLRIAQNAAARPGWWMLTGLLAGSAMACKYPGLTSVILPIGLGLLVVSVRRATFRVSITQLGLFGCGVALAVGPWLAKNTVETGNPVYPLAYQVFGGRDLDPELNAKWERGHASPRYASVSSRLQDAVRKLTDVVANNDWHSPLLFAFAPLAWYWSARRPVLTWTWSLLAWLFLAWWLLTHQIDRFWVPMIPVIALSAGAGAATCQTSLGRWGTGLVLSAGVLFNLTICVLIGGFNSGLMPLSQARQIAARSLTPELAWLNDEYSAGRLPDDFKLLCVGEAATFHARFPVVYHSVFDRCLLEELCASGPGPEFPWKTDDEIREAFHRQGITHVFINWRWIETYRQPGNYGFTDFVAPDRLRTLQSLDVLGLPVQLPPHLAAMSPAGQIFPVR